MALDQQALNLAKAIRKAETGTSTDPYNAKGASGENGAYQFMPETWKGWSKQYLGQENAPLSVENQNKVAYSRIKELKDKGLSPAQIASAWNSGNPDAYKQNKVGTNSMGVAYDVPAYVKKVSENYKAIAPAPVAPPRPKYVPPQPAPKRPTLNPYQNVPILGQLTDFGIGVGSAVGKAVFGAAETGAKLIGAEGAAEKIKGAKENLYDNQFGGSLDTMSGQVGNVVGNVAPYVATAGSVNAATKGLPIAQRILARTAPDVAIGAAQTGGDVKGTAGIGAVSAISNALIPGGGAGALRQIAAGYGVDVASGLTGQRGEDRTGQKAFIPGLGTAIGTGIPLAGKGSQFVKNIGNEELQFNKAVNKVEKKLATIEGTTKSSRNKMDYNAESRKRIAKSNVLENAVDENGVINTKNPSQKYQDEVLNKNEGVVRVDLEREGASVSADTVRKKLIEKVNSSKLAGKEKASALKNIEKEMEGIMLEADASGKIPLTALHDAKIIKASGVNWMTDAFVGSERKALAAAYKELVEEGSSLPIREINKVLADYYKDLDYLKLLDGKRVAGGKLGKYFAQISGNIVGGSVGSVFGPAGSAVGTIVGGELAGKINGILKKGTLSGIKGGVFSKNPIIDEAVKRSQSPRLGLPAQTTPFKSVQTSGKTINLPARSQSTIENIQSKSEGNLKKQYAATTNTNKTSIPKSVAPAETKATPVIPKKKFDPTKQGGFVRIGKETPKTVLPKSKVNESVSSLNDSTPLTKLVNESKTSREFLEKVMGDFDKYRNEATPLLKETGGLGEFYGRVKNEGIRSLDIEEKVNRTLKSEVKKYNSFDEFVKAKIDPTYEFKSGAGIKDSYIARGTFKDAIIDIGGLKNIEKGTTNIINLKKTENINTSSQRYKKVLEEVKRGERTPLIIDENMEIMDGHHRLEAYKAIGLKEIPVIAPRGTSITTYTKSQLEQIWKEANKK